jgi:hypothetical protein
LGFAPSPTCHRYGSVLRGDKRVALYRMPPKGKPKGTCIFIHGCKHDPYSFFYKSSGCPLCTGAQLRAGLDSSWHSLGRRMNGGRICWRPQVA